MSIQYKCERCNSVVEALIDDGRTKMPEDWMRILFLQRDKRHVDLCPKCTAELVSFVGMGAIGSMVSKTDINIEEILSSGLLHGFTVAYNNNKPKEFFEKYPWLDEVDQNSDHYKYMFCDDYVSYWTFVRLLYGIAADCAARWVYAKRNGLKWVCWDSDDYERDKELEDEPKSDSETETDGDDESETD